MSYQGIFAPERRQMFWNTWPSATGKGVGVKIAEGISQEAGLNRIGFTSPSPHWQQSLEADNEANAWMVCRFWLSPQCLLTNQGSLHQSLCGLLLQVSVPTAAAVHIRLQESWPVRTLGTSGRGRFHLNDGNNGHMAETPAQDAPCFSHLG